MQQAEEDAVEATPNQSCSTWDSIQEVVMLGLGSPERSIAARYQLALALLMVEGFPELQSPVCVRDPVLTELDKAVLKECQCQVIAEIVALPYFSRNVNATRKGLICN